MKIMRSIIGVLMAGFVAEFIHTHVGLPAQSYDVFINTVAYLTKPLEALGIALIYYLIGDRLPAKSRLMKGIILSLLILLSKGLLIRQPLMNFLLANTLSEVFLSAIQVWLSCFFMCMIIALTITPKYAYP